MARLFSRGLLLLLCLCIYIPLNQGPYSVVPFLIALTFCAFGEYARKDVISTALAALYTAACLLYSPLVFFLPVTGFDIWASRPKWLRVIVFLPLAANYKQFGAATLLLLFLCILLAWLIKSQGLAILEQQLSINLLRDSSKELTTALTEKHKALLEKQDYEINLATLRERNRIAREMHDTIGHLLSSAILQSGALLTSCNNDAQQHGLLALRDTLKKGMDNIRETIHDLHDESVDLCSELEALIIGFSNCSIQLEYDVLNTPDLQIRYAFISIVKEALANISKHSNATRARIAVHEHPALYQLIVRDNGTKTAIAPNSGLGLMNMRERINSLNGVFNINTENGFELFASVKKPSNQEQSK